MRYIALYPVIMRGVLDHTSFVQRGDRRATIGSSAYDNTISAQLSRKYSRIVIFKSDLFVIIAHVYVHSDSYIKASHTSGLPTHENLSPFRLLYASLASYLLFSLSLCASSSGACRVGAGSKFACELGLPSSSSPLRGAVVDVGFNGVVAVREEGLADRLFSSSHVRWRFMRSSSAFCARSAFMERLAKK